VNFIKIIKGMNPSNRSRTVGAPNSERLRAESRDFLMPGMEAQLQFDSESTGIQMNNSDDDQEESNNNIHNIELSPTSAFGMIRDSIQGVQRRHGGAIKYYFLWTLIIYAALGSIVLLSGIIAFIEEWTFLEAVYFSVITVTTVGFGDIFPRHDVSKLLTCLLIAASLVIIAAALTRMQHVILKNYQDAIRDDSTLKNITETPGKRLAISFSCLALLTLGSTLFLHDGEGLSWVDSFYFSVITVTTVGFGDIVPRKKSGRIFTIILVCIGPLLLGRTITSFVELFGQSVDELTESYEMTRARQASMQSRSLDEERYRDYEDDRRYGGSSNSHVEGSPGSPRSTFNHPYPHRINQPHRPPSFRDSRHEPMRQSLRSAAAAAEEEDDDDDEQSNYEETKLNLQKINSNSSINKKSSSNYSNTTTSSQTTITSTTSMTKTTQPQPPQLRLESDLDLVLKYLLEEKLINESHVKAATLKLKKSPPLTLNLK
jgi:voltage-gated potassium channel Kch